MEAALLGCFMISACVFGTLLEHPAAAARRRIRSALGRRALMGVAMGLTAIGLIYSPWGGQSGAHMNPATTLTFLVLGKVAAWDAFFYVAAHFGGAVAGVAISRGLLGQRLRHESVNHVVTVPGARGVRAAWFAELAIAFGMMLTVLVVVGGMLLAGAAYAALPMRVYCAKLDHCNDRRCIFRCEFDPLRSSASPLELSTHDP
ncbi:MAG: aquaporin [Planctomycetes bacterium]|nr:aquaporin [Planctomycetota bacterium]